MIIKHCIICGKEFKVFPSRDKITKCCSYVCRNECIRRIKKLQYKEKTNYTYIQDVCIIAGEMKFEGYKVYMDNDYPAIWFNGKNYHIHRYVWEQANGPIPKGMVIHHKDFNRGNWNLSNLEMLTRAEHMKLHKIDPRDGSDTLRAFTKKMI
jgi:hypothetical protein